MASVVSTVHYIVRNMHWFRCQIVNQAKRLQSVVIWKALLWKRVVLSSNLECTPIIRNESEFVEIENLHITKSISIEWKFIADSEKKSSSIVIKYIYVWICIYMAVTPIQLIWLWFIFYPQNSIRHNLSLHNRFMRVQNEGTGKSSWWMLNPDAKPGNAKLLIQLTFISCEWELETRKKR